MKRSLSAVLCAVLLSACGGAQIKKQQAAISQLETQSGELKSKLSERETRIAALESQAADLENKLKSSQEQAESLEKSNADLSSTIAKQGGLGNRVKEVVAEKDELGRKLHALRKDKLALQAALRKSLAQTAAVQEQLDALSQKTEQDRTRRLDEETRQDRERTAWEAKVQEEADALAQELAEELKAAKASLERSGETLSLTISDELVFEPRGAKVTTPGTAVLDRIGAALHNLRGKRQIRIEGHSDNTPIKGLIGGVTSLWDLTVSRATAVVRYLHEHGGLDPRFLTASGYGEFRPVKPNDSPEGKAANRRIVLVIEPPSR
ncbi:MAG TPA: hypothetical protein DD417_15315 [Elusimicrobia bacterium]|nr:hypothetical protein [Elusimicrobiota bacterium]